MNTFILFMKTLAFVLIVGSVYFSYSNRSHFEFVVGSFVFLISVLAVEHLLPYWRDRLEMKKRRRMAEKKSDEIYIERAELEILKKEVEELKQMFPVLSDTVKTLADSLKEIKETVSSNSDREHDYTRLIKDDFLKAVADRSSKEEKNTFNKAVEALNYLKSKEQVVSFTVDDIARCVFLDKDCIIADSLIFAKENEILPGIFVERVREFMEKDLILEFKGSKFMSVAFRKDNCVYVNFALLRDTYRHILEDDERSKRFEPYLACIFKDYLCPSVIDWKKGFVKKVFEVKENKKISKRPLVVLKGEFFQDVKSGKEIEIVR